MRVIAGTAGSIRLESPKSQARPSSDRLREGLFNMLASRVAGASVLDLFAGSGALGIEALSRGAAKAVLVERENAALRAIERNLERTGLAARAVVQRRDVWACLARLRERFDLILADPPYAKRPGDANEAARLMQAEALPDCLESGGLLVVETGSASPLPSLPVWQLEQVRAYGGSHLHFFHRAGSPDRP